MPVRAMKTPSPDPSGPESARALMMYAIGKITGQMNRLMIQVG
jgi:hypothetical protein